MDFNSFLANVEEQILVPLITVLALAAFILFVWGVVKFIRSSDNPTERSKGQQHILWGLVGLAIIFGANMIITIMNNILGV
jgi:hypothetical protein